MGGEREVTGRMLRISDASASSSAGSRIVGIVSCKHRGRSNGLACRPSPPVGIQQVLVSLLPSSGSTTIVETAVRNDLKSFRQPNDMKSIWLPDAMYNRVWLSWEAVLGSAAVGWAELERREGERQGGWWWSKREEWRISIARDHLLIQSDRDSISYIPNDDLEFKEFEVVVGYLRVRVEYGSISTIRTHLSLTVIRALIRIIRIGSLFSDPIRGSSRGSGGGYPPIYPIRGRLYSNFVKSIDK
ncbi:hypothetical protein BDZ89DRAFT_1036446 [Hymenopellis radicata]|nr:hypothetical protein BDZ89DRAFT_1036446 [Hymenopellis radicata]